MHRRVYVEWRVQVAQVRLGGQRTLARRDAVGCRREAWGGSTSEVFHLRRAQCCMMAMGACFNPVRFDDRIGMGGERSRW